MIVWKILDVPRSAYCGLTNNGIHRDITFKTEEEADAFLPFYLDMQESYCNYHDISQFQVTSVLVPEADSEFDDFVNEYRFLHTRKEDFGKI